MNNLANDISNQGRVTGHSGVLGDTTFHAFLWQNGVMIDLGTLLGDFSSESSGVNDKGQVVGGSQDTSGNGRAFLWQNGVMTDLNDVIPAASSLFLLFAASINSRGDIVGLAFDKATGELPAFLATPINGEVASESATLAARGQTSKGSKVVLPEDVRKLLRQQPGFSRFKLGLMRLR